MSEHGCDVNEVSRMAWGPARLFDLFGDTPAAAKFHRARRDLAHLGYGDVAVAALDQHAFDVSEAELDGKREANGSAATNQHGNFSIRFQRELPGCIMRFNRRSLLDTNR